MASLMDVVVAYGGSNREGIDCRGFVRLCRDCGLFDGSYCDQDVEQIFLRVAPLTRRLQLDNLSQALQAVAECKGVDAHELQHAVMQQCSVVPPAAALSKSKPQASVHPTVEVVVCGLTGQVIFGPLLAATAGEIISNAAKNASPGHVMRLTFQDAPLEPDSLLSELKTGALDVRLLQLVGIWEEDWGGHALNLALRFFCEWCEFTSPDAFPILTMTPGLGGSGVVGVNNAGFTIDWMDNLKDWVDGNTRWHVKGHAMPSWDGVTWPNEEAWTEAAETFKTLTKEVIKAKFAEHGNLGLKVKEFRMYKGFREVELVN